MKRAHRQNLTLLLVVLALLGAAGWQLHRDTGHENDTLTTLDPPSIARISLRLAGTAALNYQKQADGHWWRTDGTPRPVDNDDRLSDISDIAAAHVLSWRPASDFDPIKIGLMPPQAILVLDGQTLEFGETSVTGPQHYVRVGERIALVSSRYMPRSPEIATTELRGNQE